MIKKSRILAIDFGLKRVGLAYTDEYHFSINYLPFLNNDNNLFANLKKIIVDYNIELLVLGYPNFKENFISEFKKKLDFFYVKIKELTNLNVIKIDESYSTEEAYKIISEINIKKSKKKEMKDSMSAGILLKKYIDNL